MAEDIRTTRTKNKIKMAFLKLLNQRSYQQITVSDIAKEANVNRVTFYTHYIDKACLLEDLSVDIKKKFIADAIGVAKTIENKDQLSSFSIGLVSTLFDMIEANRDLVILLTEKENNVLRKLFEDQISSFVGIMLKKTDSLVPLKYDYKYIAAFLVPGYISVILYYISNPDSITKEDFKKHLFDVTENIIKHKLFFK